MKRTIVIEDYDVVVVDGDTGVVIFQGKLQQYTFTKIMNEPATLEFMAASLTADIQEGPGGVAKAAEPGGPLDNGEKWR